MKNGFKKVLSILTVIALLLSSFAMALAEDQIEEAPAAVSEEPVQEETVQEAAPAPEAAPAAEEVITVEETPAEPAAPAAEEAPAAPAVEEAPAAPAVEEAPAAPAVEEAPAAPVVEEAPAAPAVEEVPAAPAVEEAPAAPAVEEAPATPAEEPVPSINNEETVVTEPAVQEGDGEEEYDEDEIVEIDDWGYVDPEIIDDYIPELTPEMKFPEATELKLNEKVSGTIDAENEAMFVIRCGSNKTVVLGLAASAEDVNVKINDKAVKFAKIESEETAEYRSTYELNVVAGRDYTITLTSSDPVSYKLNAADANAANDETEEEINEETETTEEVIPEENSEANTTENAEEQSEQPAAETETVTNQNEAEETKEEGITADNGESNNVEETTAEEVPPMTGWISVSEETYAVGDTITLTAESDVDLDNQVVWQTKVQNDAEWQKAGYGNVLTVTLTEENIQSTFRFRMADGNFSEEFGLNAAEESDEPADDTEAAGDAEPTEEPEPAEETEAADETEENTEPEQQSEDEFVLPEDRSVSFRIYWDGPAVLGETAHFQATLVGYEGLDYTIQWQSSTDNENWTDIEGENGETMDVLATEEANSLFYRVIVVIHTPEDFEPQESEQPGPESEPQESVQPESEPQDNELPEAEPQE